MELNELSANLKKRRLALGLSLHQAARRADTSPATLSRYENGWQRFELYTLRKLATALGCRLDVVLEPIDPAPPVLPEVGESLGFRNLKRLFWDRKLSRGDIEEYPMWVLRRVLEYGTLDDVRFLLVRMGRRRFLEGVSSLSFSSRKTESFWRRILQKEGIPCTKRSFPREAGPSWPG